MAKFITVGYGDRKGCDSTDAFVREAAHAHDARLRKAGVMMGVAGNPVQVRNPNGTKIEIKLMPFMKSMLPVAGFAVFEAENLRQAIDMVSRTPCAVAQEVVEVWPLQDEE